MSHLFKIAYGRMEVDGLFSVTPESMRSALEESWRPGASVSRYGRTWHLPTSEQSDVRTLRGRIGFVREDDLPTLDWDPVSMDFVEGAASSGVVVPFVIRLDSAILAFQLTSGIVRPRTFTGALQALLNTNPTHRWTVRPLVRHMSIEVWRESISVVSSFSFRLLQPNPNWIGRPAVEELMDSLETEVMQLKGQAGEYQSINTESNVFRQAMDHVRKGYGRAVIRGTEVETLQESEWNSDDGGSVPAASTVESSDDRTEADTEQLVSALTQLDDSLDVGNNEEPDGDG